MPYLGNSLTVQQYAPQIAYFSGNGSTTAFTLPVAVVSAAQIIVAVDNVIQNPSSAFSVSGTTITFTSAPLTGTNNIWVEYTSLQTNTIAPSAGTVQNSSFGNLTSIPFAVGGPIGGGDSSAMKNRIINGAMVIDQRNAGASVTGNDGTYSLDRWKNVTTQNGKFTVQQNAGSVTPPVGFTNYLGVTSSSAYSVISTDYVTISQNIEGFNTADLGWGTTNAKTVTLSFQVYSSLTGTFGGSISNNSTGRSYVFSYSIPSANTWTTISVTIAGDTTGTWVGATNGIGMRVYWSLGSGSSASTTAGAWNNTFYASATGATSVVGTSGATFYITGVQLEVGSSATGFEYRQFTNELQLCQRYYCKSFNYSVVPNYTDGNGFSSTIAAYNTVNFFSSVVYTYPVQMRAAPTHRFYTVNSGSSANTWDYYNGAWTAFATIGSASPSTSQLSVSGSGSGLQTWGAFLMAGNFTASAEL
jgi:hypothetical protein